MTPKQFIEKWRDNPLKERASYQIHFNDLCELVGVAKPSPTTAETYCFERGATRTGAGQGWADVWKQSHFGFEYKATRRNLGEALKQLMTYALALDNPPLLVVCDTNIIEIHTHFTNAPSEVHTIALEDMVLPANLEKLRWLFTAPDKFKPARTISQITEEAAGKFADLAQSLATRGYSPLATSHFLTQCLFCLFAEDAELLPEKLFERLLDKSQTDPAKLSTRLAELFSAMRKGGDFALEDIHWFNGGLFEKIDVLPLDSTEIKMLHQAAKLDWSGIDPTIFGTLFERGLDPKKRAQLGAHYTDPQSILRIINPVIVEPLAQEWETARAAIAAHIAKRKKSGDKAEREAQAVFIAYLERLKAFRVLDPACGSGNFLFIALRTLKDLEHRANLEAEALGLQRQITIECSPVNVLGIEINSYAAELARVTVWIGEIQWMLKNGYPIRTNPILEPLDHIENRDALMTNIEKGEEGRDKGENLCAPHPSPLSTTGAIPLPLSESQWPAADVIVGNPPFLGGSRMRGELGDDYTDALRHCYDGRVPGGADLVTYWFEKARAQIEAGLCQRAGLVSTNSIRGGANQQVLARIIIDTHLKSPDTSGHHEFNHLRHFRTDRHAEESGHSGGSSGGSGASDRQSSRPACDGRDFREPSGTDQSRFIAHQMDDGRGDCRNGDSSPLTPHQHLIKIFNAWSDEPWINDGAAVRVSLVCFGKIPLHPPFAKGEVEHAPLSIPPFAKGGVGLPAGQAGGIYLNGLPVDAIHADLTSGGGLNLTLAKPLKENFRASFQGSQKIGAFDIEGELAREWLKRPNPNGRPNSDVLKPSWNGLDLARRSRDVWIIDFGATMSEADAALYEAPFEYVTQHVKSEREKNNREAYRKYWWRHGEPRIAMRAALKDLPRYIATPEVTKHRIFAWLDAHVLPDKKLIVVARSDDTTFGILHSRFHELWALAVCTWHGVGNDPRYTPTTCFETFPFPAPASETVEIAAAAQTLNTLRNNWLNPPEWVEWVRTAEEEKAGYPARPVAKDVGLKPDLQKRTLTNLYNARPAWLNNAHKTLDAAVARAYGWADYTVEMHDDEILRRLLALNLSRAE